MIARIRRAVRWRFMALTTALVLVGFAPFVDAAGVYPGGNALTLQGRAISLTVPALNQCLTWNGTQWTPAGCAGVIGDPVTVAHGGTNSAAPLTNKQPMISLAGAIVEGGAMTNGQILLGNTGNAPTVGTPTASSPITVTLGAGSLALACPTCAVLSAVETFTGQQTFGTSGANDDQITLVPHATGAARFTLSLTTPDLTADRTVNFPDAPGTIVLKDSTDTLTNKSISGGQISSVVANATTAVSFSGSLAGDVSGTQGVTSVDKVKGTPLGTMTATGGRFPVMDGANLQSVAMSGDAALASTGAVTLTNGNGTRSNLGLAIGTNVEAQSAQLDSAAALASNGMVARTAVNTFTARTIAGGTAITVTNGDGVLGAPSIAVTAAAIGPTQLANTTVVAAQYGSATQVGQFTADAQGRLTQALAVAIGSLDAGVLTTGLLGVARGGTGLGTLALNSLYIGNGTSAPLALGVATSGQIPIGSTGLAPVLALPLGTANRLSVVGGAGSLTLNVDTGQFPNSILGDGTANRALVATGANTASWQGIVNSIVNGGGISTTSVNGTATLNSAGGGDLSGNFGAATVARINGAGLGTVTATSGRHLVADGANWQSVAMSGDATEVAGGAVTLASVGSAGSCGSATSSCANTFDAKGRETARADTALLLAAGNLASGSSAIRYQANGFSGSTAIAGAGTGYLRTDNSPLTSANSAAQPIAIITMAGMLREFICTAATGPGAGQNETYTVIRSTDNGQTWNALTSTCQIAGATAFQRCTDTADTVALSQWDQIGIKAVQSITSVAASIACTIGISN